MLLTSKTPKASRVVLTVSLFFTALVFLARQPIKVLLILTACAIPAEAQRMGESDAPALNYGTIVLDNGAVIKGGLRFYDQERISSLNKNGESKFLTPAEVERFEFFDPALGLRTFLSLPYREYKTSPERFYFFEVLIEEETFAILSGLARLRHHPGRSFMDQIPTISVNPMTGVNTAVNRLPTNVMKTYTETIYFIDDTGNIASYLITRYDHIKGTFRDREKLSIEKEDHQLVKKYLGPYYKPLKKYARRNRLNFKTREGLIKIFKEYQRLDEMS